MGHVKKRKVFSSLLVCSFTLFLCSIFFSKVSRTGKMSLKLSVSSSVCNCISVSSSLKNFCGEPIHDYKLILLHCEKAEMLCRLQQSAEWRFNKCSEKWDMEKEGKCIFRMVTSCVCMYVTMRWRVCNAATLKSLSPSITDHDQHVSGLFPLFYK